MDSVVFEEAHASADDEVSLEREDLNEKSSSSSAHDKILENRSTATETTAEQHKILSELLEQSSASKEIEIEGKKFLLLFT